MPEETLSCLVQANWKHSFHVRLMCELIIIMLLQISSQAVDKLYSHCVFLVAREPGYEVVLVVVLTSLEQAVRLLATCNKLDGIIRLVTWLF